MSHETPESLPLALLLAGAPASLAEWFATPLTADAARTLQKQAQQTIQHALRHGEPVFPVQVLEMLCRGHSGVDTAELYQAQLRSAASDYESALLELAYGQLLASFKRPAALQHLAAGFRLAAPLVSSQEYFRLLRRHEMLATLVYSGVADRALDLPDLLAEAAVIARLRQGDRSRSRSPSEHLDTLG